MYCNVTLLRTNLTPANTRLFNSRSLQKAYFDRLSSNGVTFKNCSFNGSRNIRLIGSSPILNIQGYNYAVVYLPNEKITYYSFIDNFIYVNDRAYEIELTLDYIQTYMFDIKLSNAIVKQRTLDIETDYNNKYTNKYIDKYMYYSNSYPYANTQFDLTYPLFRTEKHTSGQTRYYKYLVMTLKTNSEYPLENTYGYSGFVSVIWVVDTTDNKFDILTYYNGGHQTTYKEFYEKNQSYLINIAVIDYIPKGSDYISIDTLTNTFCLKTENEYIKAVDVPLFNYAFLRWDDTPTEQVNMYMLKQTLLDRSPYKRLVIKRLGETEQVLDLLSLAKYPVHSFVVRVSPIFPNDTLIQFDTIDGTILYTIPALTTNLAYTQDEWKQYYTQHSASIRDGLATKHSYDIEMIDNRFAGQVVSNVVGIGMGVVQTTSGDTRGVGQIASGGTGLYNSIVAYENSKLGLQQEKAMLELSWQDIKNRPNMAYNTNLNDNAKVAQAKNSTFIALQVPMQMELIKRYHERFGFEINMPINDGDGIDAFLNIFDNEVKGNKFDYVEYQGCVIFNGSIPQQSCRRIEQILEQGIYFWYVDDIGNYENNYGE